MRYAFVGPTPCDHPNCENGVVTLVSRKPMAPSSECYVETVDCDCLGGFEPCAYCGEVPGTWAVGRRVYCGPCRVDGIRIESGSDVVARDSAGVALEGAPESNEARGSQRRRLARTSGGQVGA